MDLRGGSEGSEFSGHSDYGSEVSERSTLAEILERFTIEHQPECTFKLRFKAGPVIAGADLARITAVGQNLANLVIKPANPDQVWRRLRIDSSGMVTLRSRKLRFWIFTLDASGHANPFNKTFDFSYRLATKWDVSSRGEYRNKRRYEVSPKTEARLHWSIAYNFPTVEGSLGSGAQHSMAREVHTDMGYAHLTIPRVELVCWPRGRPDPPGSGKQGGDAAWLCQPEVAGGETAAWAAAVAVGQPDALEEGPGDAAQADRAAAVASGADGGALHGAAGPAHLSSHVASLSGRWWDRHGRQRCRTPTGQLLAQCATGAATQ